MLIAWLIAVVTAIQLTDPLTIDPGSLHLLAGACAALGCMAVVYTRVRPDERLAATCIALTHVLLFSAAGCVLSYMLARTGGPLWDEQLAGWDTALGLDWLGYVRFVDNHPWLVEPLRLAYGSLIPQIIILLVAFGFTQRFHELRTVVLAAMICGTATVLLSPLTPALSSYVHLGLTAGDFRSVDPWAGYVHFDHFTALRDRSFGAIGLSEMEGIITFPSYHAGLSAVTLWGFWMTRSHWLRWPGLLVSTATIAATPVDGGHYFVDVLAGLALAAGSVLVARRAVYWRPSPTAFRALPFRHSRAVSAP